MYAVVRVLIIYLLICLFCPYCFTDVGAPFDMRGKRFLDLKISPIVPKSVPEGGQAGTSDIQSRTASPARTGTGGGSSSSTTARNGRGRALQHHHQDSIYINVCKHN